MVPPSLDLLGRFALDPRPRSSRSARDDLARQHPRRDLGCTSSHPPSPAPLGRRHLRRVSAADSCCCSCAYRPPPALRRSSPAHARLSLYLRRAALAAPLSPRVRGGFELLLLRTPAAARTVAVVIRACTLVRVLLPPALQQSLSALRAAVLFMRCARACCDSPRASPLCVWGESVLRARVHVPCTPPPLPLRALTSCTSLASSVRRGSARFRCLALPPSRRSFAHRL